MKTRCPICGATGRHERAGESECDHCGLVLRDGVAIDTVRAGIRAWLLDGVSPDGWRLEAHAVRNAGWALGLDRDGGWRPARPILHDVTLAIMARPAEAAEVSAIVHALAFPRAVVLFDASDDSVISPCAGATVAAHHLDGDFGAQRNRLQAMAPPGWVLHLDSDERPDDRLLAALGWLTRAADREGLSALGLARRNLVDGRLSDLYPDIQYRLLRADVRFEGRVHERPDVAFARTSLALAGTLEHRLAGNRVRRRTVVYGAMADDGARVEDEYAMLRPYRGPPIATS